MTARPRALGLLAAASLAWTGCAPPAPPSGGAPVVVATIFPVADLLARIAGDAVTVETLLPPRASLHTWEATPGQIRTLSQARGYVTVGGGLDGWLEGLGADAPDLATLRLTEGLVLRRADHGDAGPDSGDPHVWLDPILVRDDLVPRMTAFLEKLVPAEADAIRERGRQLSDSLTALDGEIRSGLDGLRQRGFIATHEAWGYFAERYNLRELGNLYEAPGHEPSARGLARLVDAARSAGLGSVLSEPQLSETAAWALAGELGAGVDTVDPLGGPGVPEREDYFQLMRFNARAFARALGDT